MSYACIQCVLRVCVSVCVCARSRAYSLTTLALLRSQDVHHSLKQSEFLKGIDVAEACAFHCL